MDRREEARQQPVLRHGVEHPALAEQQHEDHGREAADHAEGDEALQPRKGRRGDRGVHRGGVAAHGFVVDEAGQHARKRDVEHRADRQRAEDADHHVALGVLGLLRRGRDRVKTNIGEEHHAGRAHHAAPAILAEGPGVGRQEGVVVLRLHVEQADPDHDRHHRELEQHHRAVDAGGFADADHQQGRGRHHDQDRRHVDDAVRQRAVGELVRLEGRVHERARQVDAQGVAHEAGHVARPAHRDGGRPDRVFEHEIPADDPGDELAHRGVGVGVGRARHRDHASELAVAHAREGAADRRDGEGERHRRAGMLGRGDAGEREQARPDHRADAEADQAPGAEMAFQLVLAGFGVGVEPFERLDPEKVTRQA